MFTPMTVQPWLNGHRKIVLAKIERVSYLYKKSFYLLLYFISERDSYFFQKSGVRMSSTVNSSRRPSSMRNEANHLAASGKAFHE